MQVTKQILMTLAVLTTGWFFSLAQTGTETSDRTRIVHLKTALNHITVIEIGEPVMEVAAGSPSFRVEWRENKVFVQPTEADTATNLFIWTATQRLNYELEPAGSVREMDFAVDQAAAYAPVPAKPASPQAVLPSVTEMLLAEKPVRVMPSKKNVSKPVEVSIRDLYEKDGRLLIRYAVSNHGSQPYFIDTPQVYQLDGVRTSQSLYALVNSQLGDDQIGKLRVRRETPVKVLDGELQSERIAPAGQVVGVVALQSAPGPIVLRLDFPAINPSGDVRSDGRQARIAAFLVH